MLEIIKVKCTLFLFLVMFTFFSCKMHHKKVVKKYSDGSPAAICDYPDNKDTLSYRIQEYYPTQQLRKTADVKNGYYEGKIKTYYPGGQIYQIDSLLKPRKITDYKWDADVISFYKNGSVAEKFGIRDGYIEGMTKHYNERGVLVKQYSVTRDTVKDGIYEEFYSNGQISLKTYYKMDTMVGVVYFFKENGDTLKYYSLDNGEQVMPYKRWLENGNILEGEYADLKEKVVVWKWYSKDGKEIKRLISKPVNGVFLNPEPN